MNAVSLPLLRRSCIAAGSLLLAATLHASTIIGRTADAKNGNSLPGVSVQLEDGATAVSDEHGQFTFPDVAPGVHTITGTSVAHKEATVRVTVPAEGSVSVDLPFEEDITVLSSLVVEGYRVGLARAMQDKENATNIKDVVSTDSIGRLPDRSVADALMRLPGLNATLDEGEARYVSIRGVDPSLNEVMVDGATMAAPGGFRLGRAVSLDTIAAGQISSIEVVKSVTPDMDANAVGGAINIVSASAFDHEERFVGGSITGVRNGNLTRANPNPGGLGTDKNDGSFEFTYADRFGAGKTWGLALSGSYEKRDYQDDELQMSGWNSVTYNGASVYVPTGMEFHPKWGDRQRKGLSFNFEYRPDAQTQFYIRPQVSTNDKREQRFEIIYSTDTSSLALTSPHSGTFTAKTRSERRAISTANNERLVNVSAGMKKVVGPFTIEPMISRSTAYSDIPYNHTREFRDGSGKTGPIQFDLGDGFIPLRWDVDPTIDVPSLYSLRRTRDDFGYTDERIWSGKADVRWDSADIAGHRGFLKTGVKYLYRTRTSDQPSFRLIPVGSWDLSKTGAQLPSIPNYGGQFQTLFLPNTAAIDTFIASNPGLTTHDVASEIDNSIADNYHIDEYIYAGYAMGSIDLGKLTLLGGARWERTDATIKASVEETAKKAPLPVVVPTTGKKNYSDLFPNLQAVFHFTHQLLLRGAYTETFGRPAYEDSRPLALLTYDTLPVPANPAYPYTGSVTTGNPDIKPWHSRNYDLSLEWYARKSGGMAAVAAFRKDISNPIYTFTEQDRDVIYNDLGFDTLTLNQQRNGTSGRISGLEFTVYVPFKFLPSPFDGFGVNANLTTIRSSEVIPSRPGEDIPFFRQPSKIRNLTVFYEKYGFAARVAYTYSSEQIYTLGSALLKDVYRVNRGQYDGQVSYRFAKHYAVKFAVNNITRQPDNYSYGVKYLLRVSQLLDRTYRLSLDFNF